MSLSTYVCTADSNQLDKTSYLTQVASGISIELKKDTDMLNPVLELSSTNGDGWNYCYISELGRYYFVVERTYSQQKFIVKLTVDPLMSFASEIEDCEVIANRSSTRFNLYQKDPKVPKQENDIIVCQNFRGAFNTPTFILAVNGG